MSMATLAKPVIGEATTTRFIWPTQLKIKVDQIDIDQARPGELACPVATALGRYFTRLGREVTVAANWDKRDLGAQAEIADHNSHSMAMYILGQTTRAAMSRWDQTNQMQPFWLVAHLIQVTRF